MNQEPRRISHSSDDSLQCVTWSPDGLKVVVGGNRGNFYQSDMNGEVLNTWEGVRVVDLHFMNDGKRILAADTHHRIRSYHWETLSDRTVVKEDHPIVSFSVSKDDQYVCVNVQGQGLHVWDVAHCMLLRKYVGVVQSYNHIYSTFGGFHSQFLASGSEDGKIYLYHFKRDRPISVLSGHSRCVSAVAWNPVYHHILVSVSDDCTVRVWGPKPPPPPSNATSEDDASASTSSASTSSASSRRQSLTNGRTYETRASAAAAAAAAAGPNGLL